MTSLPIFYFISFIYLLKMLITMLFQNLLSRGQSLPLYKLDFVLVKENNNHNVLLSHEYKNVMLMNLLRTQQKL